MYAFNHGDAFVNVCTGPYGSGKKFSLNNDRCFTIVSPPLLLETGVKDFFTESIIRKILENNPSLFICLFFAYDFRVVQNSRVFYLVNRNIFILSIKRFHYSNGIVRAHPVDANQFVPT